ncbi:MAG: hypothetical protein FWG65_08535 [Turicibacter sp.]|nr:hypothetical protein [Turicibacter sp.]
MGKLFYELEAIPQDCTPLEYRYMLAKFYDSQPLNKIYLDVTNFDISTLADDKLAVFRDMATRFFVHGPHKRDISSILDCVISEELKN